ncbi:MAG TPA: MFS transporter [Gemmatimonadales bacterium]|jgi:maltose/moltooligosaccharide transporter|nr:MFS transporter [Gemmatimonadales bacterium]
MEKPRLSFWQIWNMSFGFLGIQFGFALQNANVSRIFQTLGANVDAIPILWIAAPFTGLVVQPIVGYFSDRTWNRLGRRRPYFLTGAILASLALIVMPNSPALWVAAGMLWIMDASINISMEPFRAFVGDNLAASQRVTGFALQSFFIGTGAVVASMLPWLLTNVFGVSNEAPAGHIPMSVRLSFYLGALAFFGAVAWTVRFSKEYSPEEMASFDDHKAGTTAGEQGPPRTGDRLITQGVVHVIIGLALSAFLIWKTVYQVLVLSAGDLVFGALLVAGGLLMRMQKPPYGAFVTILNDLLDMPRTMKQLAWAQFFSWFALFAMWIYTTTAVTSHIYHTTDPTSALYNDGANWVGVCFAVYNGVAALVAFGIPPLARWSSPKMAHIVCLFCGALGLLSITLISDHRFLVLSMIGVGIAWASILSMPYAILTGALPPAKLGYYMGVFNFFIVIPQIVAAAILGYLVKHFFGGDTQYALVIGGASLVLAAALMLRVKDS